MIFIALSVLCSISLAHFLKTSETEKLSTINVITVNYFVAFLVSTIINIWNGVSIIPDFPVWFWLYVSGIGTLFIANFFAFSKSVDANGMGVSIAAMRVSLLIPILVSVILYGEVMSAVKISGLLLVFIAMALFVMARRDLKLSGISSHIILLGLFLMTGIIDSSMKIFEQEMFHIASEAQFLGVIFLIALIIGTGVSIKNKNIQKLKIREIGYGAMVGIPNLLSSYFLIKALSLMDASVVYALINLLVIVGGTAVGLFIWKDKISPKEWMGLLVALAAIVLLSGY